MSWARSRRLGHEIKQHEQQQHRHPEDQSHGRLEKARVGPQMLRVVHGGVTAGGVDSHNSSLALMIAPRLWYRKPRPASSGGTAALAAPASPAVLAAGAAASHSTAFSPLGGRASMLLKLSGSATASSQRPA